MSEKKENQLPGPSTEDRTDQGKQNSSRNATTHGLSCEIFFLIPGEKQEGFHALTALGQSLMQNTLPEI